MDNINKKAVGNRIKTIRTQKGLTMKEFGKLIEEAAQSLVTRWENGTSIPNNERLKKIADLGDMSVNELLYGDMKNFTSSYFDERISENQEKAKGSFYGSMLNDSEYIQSVKEDFFA